MVYSLVWEYFFDIVDNWNRKIQTGVYYMNEMLNKIEIKFIVRVALFTHSSKGIDDPKRIYIHVYRNHSCKDLLNWYMYKKYLSFFEERFLGNIGQFKP